MTGRMIRRTSLFSLAAVLLLIAAVVPVRGTTYPSVDGNGNPYRPPTEPGSQFTIYVMTMGPGDAAWEKFGHNAIVVQNDLNGLTVAFNWGMFDFEQEHFYFKFVQGRMTYSMAGIEYEAMPKEYRGRLNRTVWLQELELTPRQKANLVDFLLWNEKPENRSYRYDYYK